MTENTRDGTMEYDENGVASPRRLPGRREFIALGIGAFAVAAVPAALRRRRRLVRRSIPVMGTVAEVAVVHRDPAHAQRAIDAALEELRWVDRTMTRFDPESEVGRANRLAARRPVPVGEETARVVSEGLRWARGTDGRFDPCLAGASALWSPGDREEPPSDGEVRRYAGRRLYRSLEVGREAGRPVIRFGDPDAGLDLGGIAKGYGVDRAADALRAWGIGSGLVNVGGDLHALGLSEDGDPWQVGIRSPVDGEGLLATLRVTDEAVATSGDYERFFDYRGRRYHHLLDPGTGEPRVAGSHSVTVAAPTCMDADAAGTAVFGMERARAEEIVARLAPEARVVRMG